MLNVFALAILATAAIPQETHRQSVTVGRAVLTADWPAQRLLDELAERVEGSIAVFERETGRYMPEGEQIIVHLFLEKPDMDEAVLAVGAGELGSLTAITAISNSAAAA